MIFYLARRDMGPVAWGKAFKAFTRLMGVEDGRGQNQGEHSATFAESARDAGVSERTARDRVNLASELEDYPNIGEMVDNKELPTATFAEAAEQAGVSEKMVFYLGRMEVLQAIKPIHMGNSPDNGPQI